ncbi:MAG: T9SS type A sorting domain-containing protein [Bacteroidota bacterium]|nr:T9SS type A sorting domain-containing protein [Bacteroidota bacterium]MDP4232886.1 T9SS type A sorting domain-containing protein [Bacteroidota bacterium]MDP4241930.1 T9SS type A sorting domain-containing protein [Bacteroidota bacterium]MDP4286833.1 T9SS type A sorting domain-containing protein [Bacteroidota bacterium]
MIKLGIALLMTLFVNIACAQWRKINDFVNSIDGQKEAVSCIYFLNQLGSSGTGYLGTTPELWKTTDGGATWKISWSHAFGYGSGGITDIVFKDSLIGWFTYLSINSEVYRTEDGGASWKLLSGSVRSEGSLWGMYYCAATKRLLLSQGDSLRVSTDLGDTWKSVDTLQTGYFSFSSDSMGILSAYNIDTSQDSPNGILRTTDAGITWSITDARFGCWRPLAIARTPICFANAGQQIYRSDDYGQTWRLLKDFGPFQDSQFNRIGPMFASYIAGDLSRLYIQSDTGLYVSTDEGITWNFDGGPSGDLLFSGRGRTLAALNAGGDNYGSLWEEDWPEAGVAVCASANSVSGLHVFPNPAAGELHVMGGASGMVHLYDLLGRERTHATMDTSGATLDVSQLEAGMYFVRLGAESSKVEIAR